MRSTYHIKDLVYGATDGIITTFAVVASVSGAHLATTIILIVGFANLFADGFSMAASNYLGTKSECDVLNKEGANCEPEVHHPARSGAYTFLAFVVAGLIPLVPFIALGDSENIFKWSVLATALALFIVGALRSLVTKRGFIRSGAEILIVGGIAATIAYIAGSIIKSLIG